MNILFVTRDFFPASGGVAIFIHHLADQLGRRGHTVRIIAPRRQGWEQVQSENYVICWCAAWQRLSSLPFIFQTLRLAWSMKAERIFLGHFMSTHGLGALLAKRLLGIPYVFLTHGNDLVYSISTRTDEWAAARILEHAALGLCNSRFTAGKLSERGFRGPIEILYPGVDTERFRPNLDTATLVEQYHLEGRKVILSVARLVEKKNVDGVLKALPIVIKVVPNLLYLVVGDGPQRQDIENLTVKLGLVDHVRFLGNICNDQLPELYCASDLYVMPSHGGRTMQDFETFGISFIEAAASGCPVVGSSSGGVPEAVIDGVTGLLVDPYDTTVIANALCKILCNETFARQLGENGRKRACEELSWQKIAWQFDEYLSNVLIDKW